MNHAFDGAASKTAIGLLLLGVCCTSCDAQRAFRTGMTTERQESTTEFDRKVMVIRIDPVLVSQGGQRLSAFERWSDPADLTAGLVAFFQSASGGRLRYTVVDTRTIDTFVRKVDGFTYDEAGYLNVIDRGGGGHHDPDGVDYGALLDGQQACERVNEGAVDEIWLFGGPYFGFNESALAGPNGFAYNGPALEGTACTRLVPIMGFSYERGLPDAVHDFGHRAEASMSHVYRSWNEDALAHAWDRFGLARGQSPSICLAGCGSVHWPPNATHDYDYGNTTPTASFCDDFANYPDLGDPASTSRSVECTAWGCSDIGYYGWWFQHLPHFVGTGPDGELNDWWQYFVDPNVAAAAPEPLGTGDPNGIHGDCNNTGTPPLCRDADGDLPRCDATPGCAYYVCANQCWPTGTPNDSVCPANCRTFDGDISACDAHAPGCAYYACSSQCWPTGTPNDTACPPQP